MQRESREVMQRFCLIINSSRPIAVIAFVWAWLLMVGVPGVLVMLRMLRRARSEPGWIRIPGAVLESRILNTAEGYLPTIRYEYNFEGDRHENSMFKSLVTASSSRSSSERVIRRYPAGANVTVYVNPNNPSDSVLEPMDSEVPYYLGVAGFFLCALIGGVGLTVALLK
jgi:Protein of unknown function (DUF3592)